MKHEEPQPSRCFSLFTCRVDPPETRLEPLAKDFMELIGPALLALQAINSVESDPAAQLVLGVAKHDYEVQEVAIPGGISKTFLSRSDGFDVRFRREKLEQVSFHILERLDYSSYQATDNLIAGVDLGTMKRAEIRAALPEPWKSNEAFDKYLVNGVVVHIAYLTADEESVLGLVIMKKS